MTTTIIYNHFRLRFYRFILVFHILCYCNQFNNVNIIVEAGQTDVGCTSAYIIRGNGNSAATCVHQNDTHITDNNQELTITCCETTTHSNPRKDPSDVCYARGKTYLEAELICSTYGGRLCTKTEIEGGIANGMGCNHDNYQSWTSDVCECPLVYTNGTTCTLPTISSDVGIYEGDDTTCQSGNSVLPGVHCTLTAITPATPSSAGDYCISPGMCNVDGNFDKNATCFETDAKYNCSAHCPNTWPYGCSGGWNELAELRCQNGGCSYLSKVDFANGGTGNAAWCLYRSFVAPKSTSTLIDSNSNSNMNNNNPSPNNPSPSPNNPSPSPNNPSPSCPNPPPVIPTINTPQITPTRRDDNISISSGFLEGHENPYINNFDQLIADSHSELKVAPLEMKNNCLNKGQPFTNDQLLPTVSITPQNGNVVSSADVQSQCGTSSICVIESNTIFNMDGNINIAALEIKGTLKWNKNTQSLEDLWLCAGYIAILSGGTFKLDLSTNVTNSKNAYIFLKDNGAKHTSLGTRVFGAAGLSSPAYIDIAGRPFRRTWSLLAKPLMKGETRLTLMHDPILSGWKIGDRIVVGPTESSSSGQAQAFRIIGFGPYNLVHFLQSGRNMHSGLEQSKHHTRCRCLVVKS